MAEPSQTQSLEDLSFGEVISNGKSFEGNSNFRPVVAKLQWKGEDYDLYEGENFIGRDNICEVTFKQASLSSKHAEIVINRANDDTENDTFIATIRDLRSSNGTFVEIPAGSGQFQKLTITNNRRNLDNGTQIRFGMICCSFSFKDYESHVTFDETQFFDPNAFASATNAYKNVNKDLYVKPRQLPIRNETDTLIDDPMPDVQESDATADLETDEDTPGPFDSSNSKKAKFNQSALSHRQSNDNQRLPPPYPSNTSSSNQYGLKSPSFSQIHPINTPGSNHILETATLIDPELGEPAAFGHSHLVAHDGDTEVDEEEDEDDMSQDLLGAPAEERLSSSAKASPVSTNKANNPLSRNSTDSSSTVEQTPNAIGRRGTAKVTKPYTTPQSLSRTLTSDQSTVDTEADRRLYEETLHSTAIKASILSELETSTPAPVKSTGKKGAASATTAASRLLSNLDADATDDEEAHILQSAQKGRRGKNKVASTLRNKLLASQDEEEGAMQIDDKNDQTGQIATTTSISATSIVETPLTNSKGNKRSKRSVDTPNLTPVIETPAQTIAESVPSSENIQSTIAKGKGRGKKSLPEIAVSEASPIVENPVIAEDHGLPSRGGGKRTTAKRKANEVENQVDTTASALATPLPATEVNNTGTVYANRSNTGSNKKKRLSFNLPPMEIPDEVTTPEIPGKESTSASAEPTPTRTKKVVDPLSTLNLTKDINPESETTAAAVGEQIAEPATKGRGGRRGTAATSRGKSSAKSKVVVEDETEETAEAAMDTENDAATETSPVPESVTKLTTGRGKRGATSKSTSSSSSVVEDNVAASSRTNSSSSSTSSTTVQANESTTTGIEGEEEKVIVLFTKLEESNYQKQLKKLQSTNPHFEITTDPTIATHCLTTNELRRTPKLMIALNCNIQYIIHEQWLLDSAKKGKILPILNPSLFSTKLDDLNRIKYSSLHAHEHTYQQEYKEALTNSSYLIQDKEKELLWDFNLVDTLTYIKFSYNPLLRRRENTCHVFQDYMIFLTKGLCGVTAPSEEEMKQIVSTGGGTWLNSLADFFTLSSGTTSGGGGGGGGRKKKSSTETSSSSSSGSAVEGTKSPQLLVISHATVYKKELKKDALEKIKSTGTKGIYTIELLFQGVLRQKLDLSKNFLEEF